MLREKLFIFILFFPLIIFSELPLEKVPPKITLKDDLGGRVTGEPWSSDEIRGKVFTFYYVDPDEKDLNEPAYEALKAAKFPDDKTGSIAVINMAATWLPNIIIGRMLKAKQKKYPKTIYVKDLKKNLHKQWGLADNSSCIAAFDKEGKVFFSKDGKLSDKEIQDLIALIRQKMEE